MLGKLYSIRPQAWILLGAMAAITIFSTVSRLTDLISPKHFLFIAQPIMIISVALLARRLAGGQKDRIRHKNDKMLIVASVLVIWFVLYFLSGLALTYVHNALVVNLKGTLMNILAYGIVAACAEYARYVLTLLTSRRNVVWFGTIVATVFALQQMSFSQLADTNGLDGMIKMILSSFVPIFISSMLLSYMAITCGLGSMLVYRLGIVAFTILPPIVPKYDWYLLSVSSIVLTVCVYIAVDRNRQDRRKSNYRRFHQSQQAYDIMFVAVIIALAIFMTGVLSYKPMAIVSNSMKPVFSRGSMVVIQKVKSPMDVQIGDIVQYKTATKAVTHRVIAIDGSADGSGKRVFTTKGDNNPTKDLPVEEWQVVGVVKSQVPYIGYPSVWLQEASKNVRGK